MRTHTIYAGHVCTSCDVYTVRETYQRSDNVRVIVRVVGSRESIQRKFSSAFSCSC